MDYLKQVCRTADFQTLAECQIKLFIKQLQEQCFTKLHNMSPLAYRSLGLSGFLTEGTNQEDESTCCMAGGRFVVLNGSTSVLAEWWPVLDVLSALTFS